jgi:hypothetical protein
VRREHPEAFAGSYEPADLGPGVCAYTRGGSVLVAVAVDPTARVHVENDVLGLDGLALALV